ncbi:MAG: LysM peptidoglycan-binding domain-containing protein [Bdellovibrionales bacterium]|nr:LysM peptidoglycan-binding domain-containing protein [Oligoflexia bacterium]
MSPRKLSLFVLLLGLIVCHTQTSFASHRTYTVNDQISLSEISIQLYGKPEQWKEIAQYNHLKRPYRIRIGQILKLKHKPTLSEAEGNAALLALWRNRFGLNLQSAPVVSLEDAMKASEALKKAELTPAAISSESNFKQGLGFYQQRNYKKAQLFFERARKSNPDSYPTWFYEINCLKAQHRFSGARELAHQLILSHSELASMPALSESALNHFSENGSE